jgi:uncharacterized protein (TIGR00369 family)
VNKGILSMDSNSSRAAAGDTEADAGLAMTFTEACDVLAQSPFAQWWGLRVDSIGLDSATVSLPSAPHLLRPGGVLQGASYDVVADVAVWLAIMTRKGRDASAVTVELKTNFLRSTAKGIVSTARLIHQGRRLTLGSADTFDTDGRLVAHTSMTYLLLEDDATHPVQAR